MNTRVQTFSDGDASRAATLHAAFPPSGERAQPNFPRKDEARDGASIALLLVFRWPGVREFRCHFRTYGTVGERSLPGDHVLVGLRIRGPPEKPLFTPHPLSQACSTICARTTKIRRTPSLPR